MPGAPTDSPAAATTTGVAADGRLLEIDAGLFRACFDRRPFYIGHRLVGHPLFALPRLIELACALPAEDVEYNAGDVPLSLKPELTPRNGLSPEETLRRIEECRSWMVLKSVEKDPEYAALLRACLEEVCVHSEPLRPGMRDPQGFIFVSSPGSVTPYHMDPEHNFLLQIRGTKAISLFDGRDRSILSEAELERFHAGGHRNLEYRPEYEAKAWHGRLVPGLGLHFPATAPHHVRNGDDVSVSFSITFRTPDLDVMGYAHRANGWLRRRGIRPVPPGRFPLRDRVKSLTWRAARRAGLVR